VERRVYGPAYAVGWSNGGYLVTYAADLFDSIAPISGYAYSPLADYVTRPTPVLIHHSEDDPMVRIGGCCSDPTMPRCCCQISEQSDVCVGVREEFERWVEFNGCTNTVETANGDGVVCRTGIGCKENTTLCVNSRKGHFTKANDFPIQAIGEYFARDACEKAGMGEWSRWSGTCSCREGVEGAHCLGTSIASSLVQLKERRHFALDSTIIFIVLVVVTVGCFAAKSLQKRERYRHFTKLRMKDDCFEDDDEFYNDELAKRVEMTSLMADN